MNRKKVKDISNSKCGVLLRSVPGIIDGKKDCTDVWDMDTALHHHMYERDKYYRFLADVSDEVSPQEDFWYNYENWWNNYACDCTIISAYDLVSKKTVGCCIARSMYDRTHYYIETVYLLPEYIGTDRPRGVHHLVCIRDGEPQRGGNHGSRASRELSLR